MTSIRIEPAGARDLGMHRAQYDELVAALQEAGFEAEIDLWEQRAVLPFSPDILIHVGEAGATAKGLFEITQLLRRIMRRLRRPPTGEPRRAVIYGPNGEALKTVELPDDDGEP
ncbi:MAG: hypothetical protein M3Z06_08430 [Actinomycetota bacterium]|nr:hypothetical protein [Actinomycetota bacterium]